MRNKKELIGLFIQDLLHEEVLALEELGLEYCDHCGLIELKENIIEFDENETGDEQWNDLITYDIWKVCESCNDKIDYIHSQYNPDTKRVVFQSDPVSKKCGTNCPHCDTDDSNINFGEKVWEDVIYQVCTCRRCKVIFKMYYDYTDTEYDKETFEEY